MSSDELKSRLQNFVLLENRLRLLFKNKLDIIDETEYLSRMEKASALWRADEEVIYILRKLSVIGNEINLHFLEYTLDDILRLFFFFVGAHEEYFFKKDGSHSLFDLINKPSGYSFNNTMSFVCNRFEEAVSGKDVYANNDRIEMSLAYLLIFISRILFSPYLSDETKDLSLHGHILNVPIRNLVNNNISLMEVSRQKQGLNEVLEGIKGDIITFSLSKEKWRELVSIALQNLINLISISDYLKNEIYDSNWRLLRPTIFERSKQGWTTKIFMCVRYEGQISSPEFPFQSLKPKQFIMYD
ncbi:MAG: hypothetical protein K9N07_10315 [Candidatus Cloacimonetes bacterium]|nr:hypothetical protein [Candidatus Cloacimonadota bacterium]